MIERTENIGLPIDLLKMKKVNLKKVTISFNRNKKILINEIKQVVFWKYFESIIIDHEENKLVINQIVSNDVAIKHEYIIKDALDKVLFLIEDIVKNRKEEMENIEIENIENISEITDKSLYSLKLEYYNEKNNINYKGIYNQDYMPYEWVNVIDELKNIINFYGSGELLNKKEFLKVDENEIIYIYCSVSIVHGKVYYYLTEDETLKIGDRVVVPFGSADQEFEGVIKDIEYYSECEVPLPLNRMKKIKAKL